MGILALGFVGSCICWLAYVAAQVLSLAHTPFPLSYCSQTPDFKGGRWKETIIKRARHGGKYL